MTDPDDKVVQFPDQIKAEFGDAFGPQLSRLERLENSMGTDYELLGRTMALGEWKHVAGQAEAIREKAETIDFLKSKSPGDAA